MEAEELLKKIREFIEEELDSDFEPIITPTMYDPNDKQFDISIIVMEKVEGGTMPRFHINLKDLKRIRNLRKAKINSLK